MRRALGRRGTRRAHGGSTAGAPRRGCGARRRRHLGRRDAVRAPLAERRGSAAAAHELESEAAPDAGRAPLAERRGSAAAAHGLNTEAAPDAGRAPLAGRRGSAAAAHGLGTAAAPDAVRCEGVIDLSAASASAEEKAERDETERDKAERDKAERRPLCAEISVRAEQAGRS